MTNKAITDSIGQVLVVGSVVMPTSNSSAYMQPQVVTRLGSKDSVQLNGSSYLAAGLLIAVDLQVKAHKGEAFYTALVQEHEQYFNLQPVEKKPASPRFMVLAPMCQANSYKQPKDNSIYILEINGTSQERARQIGEFVKSFGAYSTYCGAGLKKRKSYGQPEKLVWTYEDQDNSFSRKDLKELGLEQYIGNVVPEHIAQGLRQKEGFPK